MEWLLWSFVQSTWFGALSLSLSDSLCICIFRVRRNNIKAYYISRKCHWLPLHSQRPQRHYNIGQISHYEDKWPHKNTITYHSACRIYYELLRGAKKETQRLVGENKKLAYQYNVPCFAYMTHHGGNHMGRHVCVHKCVYSHEQSTRYNIVTITNPSKLAPDTYFIV